MSNIIHLGLLVLFQHLIFRSCLVLEYSFAWICGDVCVWKPSEKTPLCSVACQKIIADILKENDLPEGISCLINGDYKVGEYMTKDKRIPLISATGQPEWVKLLQVK